MCLTLPPWEGLGVEVVGPGAGRRMGPVRLWDVLEVEVPEVPGGAEVYGWAVLADGMRDSRPREVAQGLHVSDLDSAQAVRRRRFAGVRSAWPRACNSCLCILRAHRRGQGAGR